MLYLTVAQHTTHEGPPAGQINLQAVVKLATQLHKRCQLLHALLGCFEPLAETLAKLQTQSDCLRHLQAQQ